MKTSKILFAPAIVAMLAFSCKETPKEVPLSKTDITEFLGQWTIDIQGGSVGWLEVQQKQNYPDADLLWGGGSVLPVSNVFLANNNVLIIQRSNNAVRTRDENNNPVRARIITNWLEIKKESTDKMTGWLLTPKRDGMGVDSISWAGKKLPPVPPAPDMANLKFGKPITLFNGKDLKGWKLINEKQTNGFKVVDGILVTDPVQTEGTPHISYGNIRTEQEFEDFNLKLEVNVPEGSNSGVYLRGIYEIQVFDSYKKPLDSHNMGALYSRITPTVNAEKPAGTWQTLDMTLCNRHLTVLLNGVNIIDNQPIYGPTGGAMKSDVFAPGPIYLQGDHGKVSFRNIVLKPVVK